MQKSSLVGHATTFRGDHLDYRRDHLTELNRLPIETRPTQAPPAGATRLAPIAIAEWNDASSSLDETYWQWLRKRRNRRQTEQRGTAKPKPCTAKPSPYGFNMNREADTTTARMALRHYQTKTLTIRETEDKSEGLPHGPSVSPTASLRAGLLADHKAASLSVASRCPSLAVHQLTPGHAKADTGGQSGQLPSVRLAPLSSAMSPTLRQTGVSWCSLGLTCP